MRKKGPIKHNMKATEPEFFFAKSLGPTRLLIRDSVNYTKIRTGPGNWSRGNQSRNKRVQYILPLARARPRNVQSELERTERPRDYPVQCRPRCRNGVTARQNWADVISFPTKIFAWQPFAALWTSFHCRRRCPCRGRFWVFALRSRLRMCHVRSVRRDGELPSQVPDSGYHKYYRLSSCSKVKTSAGFNLHITITYLNFLTRIEDCRARIDYLDNKIRIFDSAYLFRVPW